MSNETTGGFCRDCSQNRLFQRAGTSHLLHFFMSIFTMGLWIIVWFGSCIKFGGWNCSVCGCTTLARRKKTTGEQDSVLNKFVKSVDHAFDKTIDQPFFDQSQETDNTSAILSCMVKEDHIMSKTRSQLELKKIDIAKNFVSRHNKNCIADWATSESTTNDDDDDLLYIYAMLISEAYGNVRAIDETYDQDGNIVDRATEFEIEIHKSDSLEGNSILFNFNAVGDEIR